MTRTYCSQVERLSGAALADAIARICLHRAHIPDLVSPTPGRKLFGRAVTIRYIPYRADMSDNDELSFGRFFYEAIGDDGEGAVLVLDCSGQHEFSVGGSVKFSRLHNRRLAGLVTDARVRDFEALAALEPIFYCRGETVEAGTTKLMPVAANVPVSLSGTTVLPGDYIHADRSGALVIPSQHVRQVLEAAAMIDAKDKELLPIIRDEGPRSPAKEQG
ncbi:MAG TPA: RraA family protein [Sphingomicrobium sp.]|nr:RraA family protein [Sphingomicrobium sp.]